MDSKDQGIVVTALLGLAAVFNESMGDKRITSYLEELDRLDANQVLFAIRIHLSNGGKLPEAKAILFFAKQNSRGIKPAKEEVAGDITSQEQREYCLGYASDFRRKMGWK